MKKVTHFCTLLIILKLAAERKRLCCGTSSFLFDCLCCCSGYWQFFLTAAEFCWLLPHTLPRRRTSVVGACTDFVHYLVLLSLERRCPGIVLDWQRRKPRYHYHNYWKRWPILFSMPRLILNDLLWLTSPLQQSVLGRRRRIEDHWWARCMLPQKLSASELGEWGLDGRAPHDVGRPRRRRGAGVAFTPWAQLRQASGNPSKSCNADQANWMLRKLHGSFAQPLLSSTETLVGFRAVTVHVSCTQLPL